MYMRPGHKAACCQTVCPPGKTVWHRLHTVRTPGRGRSRGDGSCPAAAASRAERAYELDENAAVCS